MFILTNISGCALFFDKIPMNEVPINQQEEAEMQYLVMKKKMRFVSPEGNHETLNLNSPSTFEYNIRKNYSCFTGIMGAAPVSGYGILNDKQPFLTYTKPHCSSKPIYSIPEFQIDFKGFRGKVNAQTFKIPISSIQLNKTHQLYDVYQFVADWNPEKDLKWNERNINGYVFLWKKDLGVISMKEKTSKTWMIREDLL